MQKAVRMVRRALLLGFAITLVSFAMPSRSPETSPYLSALSDLGITSIQAQSSCGNKTCKKVRKGQIAGCKQSAGHNCTLVNGDCTVTLC